jgi:hypothetical protein
MGGHAHRGRGAEPAAWRGPVRWSSRPRSRPARSSEVLLDHHQPRRGRMDGVGAAHDPLAALLVPQPDLAGPGQGLTLIQRPAPAAAGAPRRAGPGAEALAEVVRADRPRQPAQRPWSPITIPPTGPSGPPWSHHATAGSDPHAARVIGDDTQGARAADRLGWHRPGVTTDAASVESAHLLAGGRARHPDARPCRGRTLAA